MKKWGVQTIDLKKVPLGSPLKNGGRGKAIEKVENVVFFVAEEDIQANGDVTAYEYEIDSDALKRCVVTEKERQDAGEIYWGHPSIRGVRDLLQELETHNAV